MPPTADGFLAGAERWFEVIDMGVLPERLSMNSREIWLPDENGDVRAPIQRLGRLDLTGASKRAGPAGVSVWIRVTGEMQREPEQAPQVVGSNAELA